MDGRTRCCVGRFVCHVPPQTTSQASDASRPEAHRHGARWSQRSVPGTALDDQQPAMAVDMAASCRLGDAIDHLASTDRPGGFLQKILVATCAESGLPKNRSRRHELPYRCASTCSAQTSTLTSRNVPSSARPPRPSRIMPSANLPRSPATLIGSWLWSACGVQATPGHRPPTRTLPRTPFSGAA